MDTATINITAYWTFDDKKIKIKYKEYEKNTSTTTINCAQPYKKRSVVCLVFFFLIFKLFRDHRSSITLCVLMCAFVLKIRQILKVL